MKKKLDLDHTEELKRAVSFLESESLTIKLLNYLGQPIEFGINKIPKKIKDKILPITGKALHYAAKGSIKTIGKGKSNKFSNYYHKAFTITTGGISGFFGPETLIFELPVSTLTIFRSIASIAKKNGEDLQDANTVAACIEVFALGGNNKSDDATDSSYYMVRAGTNKIIEKLSENVLGKSLTIETPQFLSKIITIVAPRYSVQVTEKLVAQSLPIIGAMTGAAINLIFITHFQNVAEGHFIVRRLERIYGKKTINDNYLKIKNEIPLN